LLKSPRDDVDARRPDDDLEEIIRRAAQGDASAIAALYDSTSRLVFGLIVHILGDRFAAEEVLLDVYTQVWCQASSYEQQRGTPLSWLMTMARTRAIDRMRSGKQYQQRKEPLDLAVHQKSGEVGPEEAAAISERRTLVRSALETLSPPQREVIELAYYSGLSHSEIAAHLGQPLGTVKTRARLGMMKLCEMLRPLGREQKARG